MSLTHDPETLTGHVLTREAYVSRDYFDREQELLFGRCWQFAGMTDELAEPGDYVCANAGVHPLVVVRGHDHELRAFHNICRHRGAALLAGAGNVQKSISCFYHRWNYALDGTLKHIPQQDEFFCAVNRAEWGLLPAAAATYKGMVFVHPDPQADRLERWLGAFPTHHGPYMPETLMEIVRMRKVMKGNWKVFIENHMDGYHLAYLHQRSLGMYAHRQQENYLYGRHWSFYEPPVRDSEIPLDAEQTRLPTIDHIDRRWWGSSVHMLFPNLALVAGGTFWMTMHAIPIEPDVTEVDIRIRCMPASKVAIAAKRLSAEGLSRARRHARVVGELVAAGSSVARGQPFDSAAMRVNERRGEEQAVPFFVDEDQVAIEAVQRALRSPLWEIGPLAGRYEEPIVAFQRNVEDHVGAGAD
jgi:phenylpropionate dioxygenase-like ring-hydroxylating dioxygenase large terminal subunit